MTNATRDASRKSEKTDEKEEKDVGTIAVQVPTEFKTQLENAAKTEGVTVARFIRRNMAELLNFNITPFEQRVRTRSSKFSSDEERERAKKENAEKRANTIKALMAKYKSGEITLSDEELAAAAVKASKSETSDEKETATA